MSNPSPFDAPTVERLAPLFPGYEIHRLIATGGMGAVYEATQISLERPVAIKILPEEFGRDLEFRASFETEAKTMARLNHPNLIGVYDFGEVEGMLFIVMEYVDGETLFHAAHGTAIDPKEAAGLVAAVCDALAHAHEHGILHRDIKPSNILLDPQARPKIGDFGLARPVGAKLKEGETIFGTPHYTAPEVLKHPNHVDARADMFSVGVVFHELLTGKLPDDDKRPPSVIKGCDPRYDAVIRRATHPSPQLRYASLADLAREIRSVASTSGASAGLRPAATGAMAGAKHPMPHQARRMVVHQEKSSNGGVIFAVLAVVAAIVVVLVIANKKPQDENRPVTPVAPSSPPPPAVKPEPPPRPKPKPEPAVVAPAPQPEPVKEPEPAVVKPEPVVPPAPEPEVAPVASTFDLNGFLTKARTVTRQRAAPWLAEADRDLLKNLESFERRAKREIRDLDKVQRPLMEDRLQVSMAEWKEDGNRLPKDLNALDDKQKKLPGAPSQDGLVGADHGKLKDFFEFLGLELRDHYRKQLKIEGDLQLKLVQIADNPYVLGLRMQAERLTAPADAEVVAAINEEINLVKSEPKYFVALMRGMETEEARDSVRPKPDPAEEKKDEKKDGENK